MWVSLKYVHAALLRVLDVILSSVKRKLRLVRPDDIKAFRKHRGNI